MAAEVTVVWWKSQRFTQLWQSIIIMTLGWVMVALSTNVWDWRTGLLVPILSSVVPILRDWWSVTVTAPGVAAAIGANTNNVDRPVKPPVGR